MMVAHRHEAWDGFVGARVENENGQERSHGAFETISISTNSVTFPRNRPAKSGNWHHDSVLAEPPIELSRAPQRAA
jgi:hypothetical protein